MVFKFAYFVEFTKGYQSAKFQCCRLFGSSFIEGLQKHSDDACRICVIIADENVLITFINNYP